MQFLRRVLFFRVGPNPFRAAVLQPLFTAIGVFTFLAGVFYLPSLGPTRVEGIICLLLLAIFTLLCTAVGQLFAVAERLEKRGEKGG